MVLPSVVSCSTAETVWQIDEFDQSSSEVHGQFLSGKVKMDVLHKNPTVAQLLEEKIRTCQAKVGIVGLGYVGLPLSDEFAKAGFSITRSDLSDSKIAPSNSPDS